MQAYLDIRTRISEDGGKLRVSPARRRRVAKHSTPSTAAGADADEAQHVKTFVLMEAAPVQIVLHDVTVSRVQRMLARTGSGYRTMGVSGEYMERVKLVALCQRMFAHSVSPPPSAVTTPQHPSSTTTAAAAAAVGGLDADAITSKPGTVFLGVHVARFNVIVPLITTQRDVSDVAIQPSAATSVNSSVFIGTSQALKFNTSTALDWAFNRTTGLPLVSKTTLLSAKVAQVGGEVSGGIPTLIALDVLLADCYISTMSRRGVARTPNCVRGQDAVSGGDMSVSSDSSQWLAASANYDALQAGFSKLQLRCYEIASPSAFSLRGLTDSGFRVTQEAEWSNGLECLSCLHIVQCVKPKVDVWYSQSINSSKFPRFMVDFEVPSIVVSVSPSVVTPLMCCAALWKQTLASDRSSSVAVPQQAHTQVAVSVEEVQQPTGSSGPGTSQPPRPQLRRFPSMTVHRSNVTVQTRVHVEVQALEVSLLAKGASGSALYVQGATATDGVTSVPRQSCFREATRLRIGNVLMLASQSKKVVDCHSAVESVVVSSNRAWYFSGMTELVPAYESATDLQDSVAVVLLHAGTKTNRPLMSSLDSQSTPTAVSRAAVVVLRKSSGEQLTQLTGSSSLDVHTLVGAVHVHINSDVLSTVKSVLGEIASEADAGHAVAKACVEVGKSPPSGSDGAPDSTVATPAAAATDDNTPFVESNTSTPTRRSAGDADAAVESPRHGIAPDATSSGVASVTAFDAWDSLFGSLVGRIGSFSGVAELAAIVRSIKQRPDAASVWCKLLTQVCDCLLLLLLLLLLLMAMLCAVLCRWS